METLVIVLFCFVILLFVAVLSIAMVFTTKIEELMNKIADLSERVYRVRHNDGKD